MPTNDGLRTAKEGKKDEFYTQLSDIENELRHYKQHFRGKVVYCNCDDPYESNFFKYFAMNFNLLGLKKLIVTGYSTSPVIGNELNVWTQEETPISKRTSYVAYINEVTDLNGDGRVDLEDVKIILTKKHNCRRKLFGEVVYQNGKKIEYSAGDFRSSECIKLLKQADIVVTNPPFSLFREYIAQLVQYGKKFIVWGNINAITYKEIFPLIKENKLWLGFTVNQTQIFQIPDSYDKWDEKVTAQKSDGKKYSKNPCISVYTNLDIHKRHEDLILYKAYNPEDYPKYDNYDAININKVSDIPMDYDGMMGVPITFLSKYNPEQFELIGVINHGSDGNWDLCKCMINGKEKFKRLAIRKRKSVVSDSKIGLDGRQRTPTDSSK